MTSFSLLLSIMLDVTDRGGCCLVVDIQPPTRTLRLLIWQPHTDRHTHTHTHMLVDGVHGDRDKLIVILLADKAVIGISQTRSV